MMRYDPYTDSFIDNPTKETTATISTDTFPKVIQTYVVEVSDESIEKIADAVVRKLADRKTEPQYDFGEYADRLWKIAYERGKREALEQTEPQTEIKVEPTWVGTTYGRFEDEPQTERHLPDYSVEAQIGRELTDCAWK